jgi:hypothetical protein
MFTISLTVRPGADLSSLFVMFVGKDKSLPYSGAPERHHFTRAGFSIGLGWKGLPRTNHFVGTEFMEFLSLSSSHYF